MVDVAERLRKLQDARGLTTYGLAKAAGIDPTYVYRILDGKGRRPSHQTLTNLAAALQVEITDLTGETNPRILTGGEDLPVASRIAQLLPNITGCDPEELIRSLAKLTPDNQALLARQARLLVLEERQARTSRTYEDRSHTVAGEPRVLGDTQDDAPPALRDAG